MLVPGDPTRPRHRRALAATVALAAALGAVLASAGGCVGAGAEEAGDPAAATEPAATELVVRRGDFADQLLLTGELRAARAHDLLVPQAPTWRLQIRWLAEDGAEVAAGDPVVQFDSTEFTSDLEQRRLSLAEQENELERTRARGEITLDEKLFALEQKRAELQKAESSAAVPEDLISPSELQDRRLALERAKVELVKAEEEVEATRAANRAELEMKRIEIGKLEREIAVAERALAELTLTAPADGLFIVEGNRWEGGRKLQEGDAVFVGMTVGRIPDLTSMEVQAMLPDVDDGRVRPGMEARCTLDAHPDTAYPCRVIAVAPVAREADRTALLRYFQVELALDGSDPERMRPGMSVQVEVTVEEAEDVLLAPRRALDLATSPPRARTADGGWREVALGPCDEMLCVVASGLEEGTRLAPAPATLAGGSAAAKQPRGAPAEAAR